jgi:hypothetical protein
MNLKLFSKLKSSWGAVVHTCNPSIQEAELGGSLIQDQFGQHSCFKKIFFKLKTKVKYIFQRVKM